MDYLGTREGLYHLGRNKQGQVFVPTHQSISDWLTEFIEQSDEAHTVAGLWHDQLVQSGINKGLVEITGAMCKISSITTVEHRKKPREEYAGKHEMMDSGTACAILQLKGVTTHIYRMSDKEKDKATRAEQNWKNLKEWRYRDIPVWSEHKMNRASFCIMKACGDQVIWDNGTSIIAGEQVRRRGHMRMVATNADVIQTI